MRRNRRLKSAIILLLISPFVWQFSEADDQVLVVSHQWPAEDFRHRMATLLSEKVAEADVGLKVEIYSKESRFKARDQWDAMTAGLLDISVFPLAYAAAKHPEFNLTLMPGIIRDHEHARRFNDSAVMAEIEKIIDAAGVIVLADAWLAGGIVSRGDCIDEPKDAEGKWMRAAGTAFNLMLRGSGANIASMPSSQIRAAFETEELDGAITSSSSLVSFKIYLQSKCLIPPDGRALWFMYEPMLMSKVVFEGLTPEQRAALRAAGEEAEEYAYLKAKEADQTLVATYQAEDVKVRKMSDRQFRRWIDVAKETSYKVFREEVNNGERLLRLALKVE